MPECYIRGSTIKYLRIPDEIIDMVKEEVLSKGRGRGGAQQNKQQGKGRGGAGRGEWITADLRLFHEFESTQHQPVFLLSFSLLFWFVGVFGSRGRGMTGPGRGQQQMQEKKSGKPQGMKNQHWKQFNHFNSTNLEHLLFQYMKIKWLFWCFLLLRCLSKVSTVENHWIC